MKPLKAKPQFYALCFQQLQEIAFEKGYNLVLHGSLNRDMDLIAIPWVNETSSELELIYALHFYLCGKNYFDEEDSQEVNEKIAKRQYLHSYLPGGRSSWVINLNRTGIRNGQDYADAEFYLDISITPLILR